MADAAYGVHIDTNTPQGLRAKQTMDMLNSDWPIGTVGVRTMAAPEQVDEAAPQLRLGDLCGTGRSLVTGLDIGAGQATLHVLTSYGVAQDIQLRTNDAGLVDRFDVSLQPPVIKKWARHRRRADEVGRALLVSGVEGRQRRQVRNWSQAPTPTCRCRWRRSSNCMCCLRLPMPSRRGR